MKYNSEEGSCFAVSRINPMILWKNNKICKRYGIKQDKMYKATVLIEKWFGIFVKNCIC